MDQEEPGLAKFGLAHLPSWIGTQKGTGLEVRGVGVLDGPRTSPRLHRSGWESTTPHRNLDGLHILLVGGDVEDRVRLHVDLGRLFSALSVRHVEDLSALSNLSGPSAQVMVVDAGLAGGADLLAKAKASRPDLVSILLAAPGQEGAVLGAMGFGLDGHLLKIPGHQALLGGAIRSLLRLPQRERPCRSGSHLLLNRLNALCFRATLSGKLMEANPPFLEQQRLSRWEAVRELRLGELFEDGQKTARLLKEVARKGSFFDQHMKLRLPDGGLLPVALTAVAGGKGEAPLICCLESRARKDPIWSLGKDLLGWRLIEQQLPAVFWSTDRELHLIAMVGAGLKHLGLAPKRPAGQSLYTFFGTDDRSHATIAAHLNALSGRSQQLEQDWWGRRMQIQVEPLVDERGSISGCLGMALDIHRQNVAERKLEESLERSKRFFKEDLTGDFMARPEGHLVDCNPAFLRIMGLPSLASALSHSFADFLTGEEECTALLAELRSKRKLESRELRMVRPDGRMLDVVANLVGTLGKDGKLVGITGYLFDNSARKSLEEQLRRSQRLEAVGRLAGGVAHDFNNLLTAINGYASLLLKQLDQDRPAYKSAQAIQKAGTQAAAVTRQLRAFSRRQELCPQAFELHQVIQEMQEMLRHLMSADVDLVFRPGEKSAWVRADRSQVEQVLLNLVLNARDAMPHGGRLEITTETVQAGPEGPLDLASGPYVLMKVRDEGFGMDPATQERIFDPFFTTKHEGEGLGLATAYGILTQSGGGIDVQSRPGAGATFLVYLPHTEARPGRGSQPAGPKECRGGSETVLVAEDNDNVRALVEQVLSSQGYQVVSARNGREAIRKLRENEGPVELLLADVVLPDFGGRDLSEILRASRPRLGVLFMSAEPKSAISSRGVMARGPSFLAKPFSPEELLIRVREVLDGGREEQGAAEAL